MPRHLRRGAVASLLALLALLATAGRADAAAATLKTADTTNVTKFPNDSSWLMQTGTSYSTQHYYRNDNATTAYIQWRHQGLTGGTLYSVANAYKESTSNRSTATRFQAIDSDGTTVLATRYVNQRHITDAFTYDGTTWRGLFNVTPTGTTLYVRMYGDNAGTTDFVIGDGSYIQPASDGLPAGATAFSVNDGNYSAQATWFGATVPGSTGTANIYTTVNVDSSASIGASGATGSVAMTIKRETGKLIVNDGVTFTVRGNIVLAQAQTTNARTAGYFPLQVGQGLTGGAVLEFDSSLSSTPGTIYYEVVPGASTQYNATWKSLGVAGNVAIVRSNAGGVYGRFGMGGFINGPMGFDARYTRFLRVGTSSAPAISCYPNQVGTGFSLRDCEFVDCGRALSVNGGLNASADITVQNVVTTGTTATTSVSINSSTPTNGTFARVVDNLRTDKTATFVTGAGLNVTNCVFKSYTMGGTTALWQYNMTQDEVSGPEDIRDSYFFVDNNGDTFNAHAISGGTSVLRSVFDCPRSTQGEMMIFTGGGVEGVSHYNLMLPNSSNTGPGVLIVTPSNTTIIRANHNTITSTQGAGGNAETGVTTFGETFSGLGGADSIKSNLVYTPSGKGLIASRRNMQFVSDPLSAANSANNAGNNLVTTTGANTGAVYGAQGGYADTAVVAMAAKTTGTTGSFTVKCYHSDGVTFAETAPIAYNASAATTQTAILAAFNSLGDGTYAGGTPGNAANASTGTLMNLTRNGVAFDYARKLSALRPGSTNTTGGTTYTSVPMYSTTPTGLGDTDLTVADLAFHDTTRNVATFDRAYLGYPAATAWADATAYAVGDIRSASDAGAFGGATINYRCVAAHTSAIANGTNGKPNTTTTGYLWRTNWEYVGAYYLRTSVDVYDGVTAKCTARDLIAWVRAGWAPTTASIATAGHDGTTIGAIPYLSAAASGAKKIKDQLLRQRRRRYSSNEPVLPFSAPAAAVLVDDRRRPVNRTRKAS